MTANQEIIAELRRVLGERDEARKEREELLDRVAFLESYSETLQGYQTDLAQMLKAVCAERDRLREQLYAARSGRLAARADRLQRERDEARHEASDHRLAAMAASSAHEAIEKMVRFELRAQQEEGAQEACRRVARERDEARAEVATAYRRGAEAMREACARWMSEREGISQWVYDDALSALPIPEDKP